MCRLQLDKLQPLDWFHSVTSKKYQKRSVFCNDVLNICFYFLYTILLYKFLLAGFPCIWFYVQSYGEGCNSKFRLWLYVETGISWLFPPFRFFFFLCVGLAWYVGCKSCCNNLSIFCLFYGTFFFSKMENSMFLENFDYWSCNHLIKLKYIYV